MRRARILGIIMAGGKGERLHPLTRERSKPAVPFGGKYRIVDFVLSNFVNSGIFSIYVLVQYKSQSLIEHLQIGWRHGGLLRDHFISIVPPQMRMGEMWYRGTADAVAQNLHLIQDFNPDMVAIFGADHIYRMDLNQMLTFHQEAQADVTVAARPVAVGEAAQFGVLAVDRHGRVVEFTEKPPRPSPMPGDSARALVSMGNYLFDRRVLVEALVDDARRSTEHDFGRSIIPELVESGRVFAYDFQQNEVPGVKPYEEHGYWRDVGTVQAYWDAHPCGTQFTELEWGSQQFFDSVSRERYARQPFMAEAVGFSRYSGKELLEIGCGLGTDLLEFARGGARVTGLDLTPAVVALARRRFELEGASGNFVVGDAERLPFADNRFDVVYSFGVLHHTPDTGRAFAEVRRILRPGGVLVSDDVTWNAVFDEFGRRVDRVPVGLGPHIALLIK